MMKISYLVICLFILVSSLLISCQSQESKSKSPYFEIKYRFKQNDVGQGRFRIAMPQSIPGIQEIHDVILDPKPSQLVTQGEENWMAPLLLKTRNQTPVPTIVLSSTRSTEYLIGERFLHFDWVKDDLQMLGFPQI